MTPRSVPLHALAARDGLSAGDPTAETYDDLNHAFKVFNAALFEGRLEPSLITLRARVQLGYFSPYRFRHSDARRTFAHEIALNPEEFGVHTIEECLSTLVRMQVHQLQHQEKTRGRRGYENRDFIARMAQVGLGVRKAGETAAAHFREKHHHFILPGGRFAQVARELIDEGFRARWADRFLVHVQLEPELVDAIVEGVPTAAADTPAVVPGHAPVAARVAPSSARVGPAAEPGDDLPAHDPIPAVVRSRQDFIFIPPERESKKTKFQCPLCRNAAWGKASLNLVCGDCRVYMNIAADDRAHLLRSAVRRLRVHPRDRHRGAGDEPVPAAPGD